MLSADVRERGTVGAYLYAEWGNSWIWSPRSIDVLIRREGAFAAVSG